MLTYSEYKQALLKHDLSMSKFKFSRSEAGRKSMYGIYVKEVNAGTYPPDLLFKRAGKTYHSDGVVVKHNLELPQTLSIHDVKLENNTQTITPCSDVTDFEEYVARKYLQLKENAKNRGKDFNLTLGVVRRLLKRKTCYYTGIPIGNVGNIPTPNSFTVDRVDPTKGYVIGNVVACSYAANQFKSKIEHEFNGVLSREKQLKMLQKMFS